MFRFTVVAVGPDPTPLATGMTPIPPSNFTRVLPAWARADSVNSEVRNAERTKAFFIGVCLLFSRLGNFAPELRLKEGARRAGNTEAGEYIRSSATLPRWAASPVAASSAAVAALCA